MRPAPSPAAATSARRRVLHIIFSRRIAGAERYCADLANRQALQGDEVHVLGLPGAMIEGALLPGVRFHALRLPRLLRGWQVGRLAERLGVDIAHAHLSPACKALARAPGTLARVATLHVGYKPHQHGRLDGLVCVNATQLNQLGSFDGLSRVISNWLPLPQQAPAGAAAARCLRTELGIAPGAFVVGSVGRLDASKGMDLMVQAFRATAPADAALVIVGEGCQRAELEKLRAGDPRIHLPGFRDDVAAALSAFDLFVSPSREETFGLALLEAMSAGLPVLSSATEGPREILRGQPARLVAPGSLYDLSAGLASAFARRQPTGVAYDLAAYEPAQSLAQMGEFYGQVLSHLARRQPARSTLAHADLEAQPIH
ncbi:glycosyltransferase [Pelomonas sp. KK5]|uniref:glycosyltransferase n=1 Tax=Pelomonas sp. KK5 TaxID=1855730 RepID=UPI00097BD5F3|nr:glycosyltransferase [Pelomonas sp. KK5]